jgi:hypothetical protein
MRASRAFILATTTILAGSCANPNTSLLPSQSQEAGGTSLTSLAPTASATVPAWLSTVSAKWTQAEREPYSTETPIPTRTENPRPLSQEGSWLAFGSSEGLWIADADGQAAQMLFRFSGDSSSRLSFAGSPRGAHLALSEPPPPSTYLFSIPTPLQGESAEPHVLVFTLPDLSPTAVAPLISSRQVRAIATEFPSESNRIEDEAGYRVEQIREAYSSPGSLAWSSNGSTLAFAAAIDGPTSDLYLLDGSTGKVRRLTSGPGQTASILWSPDDRFIIHNAVDDFNLGRSGTDIVSGLWSAAADGSSLVLLSPGHTIPIAWLAPSRLLVRSWVWMCDSYNLAIVNVETGQKDILWDGFFLAVAADPVSGAILVGNPYAPSPSDDMCPSDTPVGLFFLQGPSATPRRVGDFEFSQFVAAPYPSIEWLPSMGLFRVVDGRGSSYFHPDGREDGGTGRPPTQADAMLASDLYCNYLWDPLRQALAVSDDSTILVATGPDYDPIKIATGLSQVCDYPLQWIGP